MLIALLHLAEMSEEALVQGQGAHVRLRFHVEFELLSGQHRVLSNRVSLFESVYQVLALVGVDKLNINGSIDNEYDRGAMVADPVDLRARLVDLLLHVELDLSEETVHVEVLVSTAKVVNLLQENALEFDPFIIVALKCPLFDVSQHFGALSTHFDKVLAAQVSQRAIINALDVCSAHRAEDDRDFSEIVTLLEPPLHSLLL